MEETALDATVRETEATIAKVDAAIAAARTQLDEHDRFVQGSELPRDSVAAITETLPPEAREQFARERQEMLEELERDMPKATETTAPRVKPSRQMV